MSNVKRMTVLAHLSDPHIGPLPRPHMRELFGKRALGFVNWHRRRKAIHRMDTLTDLVTDLKEQTPDQIALTGDLVNIALPGEFLNTRAFLHALGQPNDVSVVPGNHDLYVRRAAAAGGEHWGAYMKGDNGESFPYLRRRGELALVGVSSAIPTAPFMATGKVGAQQLDDLRVVLAELKAEDRFRVVMIHHPPSRKRGDRFKYLIDTEGFAQILREHGADLVLHGHDHVHSVVYLDGPHGKQVPMAGVPSASASAGHGDLAAYNLYSIEKANGAWRCEAVTRGFRRGKDGITEIARRVL
jgi:3',5'-cyclic AMP phosphodiesterase CpdA